MDTLRGLGPPYFDAYAAGEGLKAPCHSQLWNEPFVVLHVPASLRLHCCPTCCTCPHRSVYATASIRFLWACLQPFSNQLNKKSLLGCGIREED